MECRMLLSLLAWGCKKVGRLHELDQSWFQMASIPQAGKSIHILLSISIDIELCLQPFNMGRAATTWMRLSLQDVRSYGTSLRAHVSAKWLERVTAP
jgi:hypothetical protein